MSKEKTFWSDELISVSVRIHPTCCPYCTEDKRVKFSLMTQDKDGRFIIVADCQACGSSCDIFTKVESAREPV